LRSVLDLYFKLGLIDGLKGFKWRKLVKLGQKRRILEACLLGKLCETIISLAQQEFFNF
jgi:hypothetical protein